MRNHGCPRTSRQNRDDCGIVVDYDEAQRADMGEVWRMQRGGDSGIPLGNEIVQIVDKLLHTQFGYYDNSDTRKRSLTVVSVSCPRWILVTAIENRKAMSESVKLYKKDLSVMSRSSLSRTSDKT